MDPATLAAAALSLLAPYLAKAGESIAGKIGETLPENAGKLWMAMTGKLQAKPAAEVAVKDLIQNPADEDNQAALRKELKKALTEDPEFLASLNGLFEKARAESVRNSAVAGDNSTAINVGGNVQGNIVVGSHNTLNSSGKKK